MSKHKPNPTARFGLFDNDEFFITPTNYFIQASPVQSGYMATEFGWKHFIGYTEHWVAAWEGIIMPPSGGDNFGAPGYGGIFNGIVQYNVNSKLGVTLMMGISTQTQLRNRKGNRFIRNSEEDKRFNSINPDLVITWQPKKKWQLFVECYGQSQTAPTY